MSGIFLLFGLVCVWNLPIVWVGLCLVSSSYLGWFVSGIFLLFGLVSVWYLPLVWVGLCLVSSSCLGWFVFGIFLLFGFGLCLVSSSYLVWFVSGIFLLFGLVCDWYLPLSPLISYSLYKCSSYVVTMYLVIDVGIRDMWCLSLPDCDMVPCHLIILIKHNK